MNLLEHSSATRRRLQQATGTLAVITFLGVFLNAPVLAQIGANVGGIVTDNSGAVLPGVTITITNTATGRAQALVTSADGRYRAVSLQPGPYQVVAELLAYVYKLRGPRWRLA